MYRYRDWTGLFACCSGNYSLRGFMINVHARVDQILKHIQPEWSVVDFGCGDQYLAKMHPNCTNVDKVNNSMVTFCCDLDWEFPHVPADCAVASGLIEWLVYPSQFLRWALVTYPRFYFSYAGEKADPRWQYATTIENIIYDIEKLNCTYITEQWEGQTLFFVEHKCDRLK